MITPKTINKQIARSGLHRVQIGKLLNIPESWMYKALREGSPYAFKNPNESRLTLISQFLDQLHILKNEYGSWKK